MHAASNTEKITLRLLMQGQVQGVFFRDSMRREALGFGVCGWVRNCSDGSVEAVVQGNSPAVASIVEWANHGPERARVEQFQMEPATVRYTDFDIRY